MKKIEWQTPNRMKIKTGHKTFDRQTNIISTGNIYANTMKGAYVRSWSDDGKDLLDYETNKREPGHLFRWDLGNFENIPAYIWKKLKTFSQESDESLVLYSFYHWNGDRKIIHGWIATRKHELLEYWVTGPTYKSWDIVLTCLDYVSNRTEN